MNWSTLHWSNFYSASQMREIFKTPTNTWSEDFLRLVHQWLADELLDSYLENIDENQYRERIRGIVEDMTYGCEDDNGHELKEFESTN